jgi:hypothetical protein
MSNDIKDIRFQVNLIDSIILNNYIIDNKNIENIIDLGDFDVIPSFHHSILSFNNILLLSKLQEFANSNVFIAKDMILDIIFALTGTAYIVYFL